MRIVDDLEVVDIDECQDERLFCPSRSRDLALQLHESRATEIHAGESIEERVFSLSRRRAAIGQGSVAIVFGVRALACPRVAIGKRGISIVFGVRALVRARAAIGKRSIAIVFGVRASVRARTAIGERGLAVAVGVRALPCSCPAILRGVHPVRGSFSSSDRRKDERVFRGAPGRACLGLGELGSLVSPVGSLVSAVCSLVSPIGSLVSLAAGLVSLYARTVSLVPDLVPLLGGFVTLYAGLVSLHACLVSRVAGQVSGVARLVAPIAGLVAPVTGFVSLVTGLVPCVAGLVVLIRERKLVPSTSGFVDASLPDQRRQHRDRGKLLGRGNMESFIDRRRGAHRLDPSVADRLGRRCTDSGRPAGVVATTSDRGARCVLVIDWPPTTAEWFSSPFGEREREVYSPF